MPPHQYFLVCSAMKTKGSQGKQGVKVAKSPSRGCMIRRHMLWTRSPVIPDIRTKFLKPRAAMKCQIFLERSLKIKP